jgi:hypothetical protein
MQPSGRGNRAVVDREGLRNDALASDAYLPVLAVREDAVVRPDRDLTVGVGLTG